VDLALALFDGEYTEEKLAGILFLQEILSPTGALRWKRDLPRFAAFFDDGKIHDWNVCDWFCVKVLGPLIQVNGLACAEQVARWRNAANLWRARASLVAFVKVVHDRHYHGPIGASCRVLIRRPERLAKTAVGWVLRDLSRHDESRVQQIIEKNIRHFTPETLKNATKYFPREVRYHNG
jgi:3-methyladenine DNA glycosylase AlkD